MICPNITENQADKKMDTQIEVGGIECFIEIIPRRWI